MGVLIILLFTFTIIHGLTHLVVFGTGVSQFYPSGVSGLAIGNIDLDSFTNQFKQKYSFSNEISKIIIGAEWLILLLMIGVSALWQRLTGKIEIVPIKKKIEVNKEHISTDIDTLYNLLKEKKKLRFSAIMKAFNVDKDIVTEWAKILEAGNLAIINYPKFSEPEIILEEGEKNEK